MLHNIIKSIGTRIIKATEFIDDQCRQRNNKNEKTRIKTADVLAVSAPCGLRPTIYGIKSYWTIKVIIQP